MSSSNAIGRERRGLTSSGAQRSDGQLTTVPAPSARDEDDERAEALAAWRAVADGYEHALAALPVDHPERGRMMRMFRHSCFLARRPALSPAPAAPGGGGRHCGPGSSETPLP
jgi:hypothetical protein